MNPYYAECEQMKKQANHQDKILKYLMEEETWIPDKDKNRCSHRAMQVKTTVRYGCLSNKLTKIEKSSHQAWRECREMRILYILGRSGNCYDHLKNKLTVSSEREDANTCMTQQLCSHIHSEEWKHSRLVHIFLRMPKTHSRVLQGQEYFCYNT